MAKKVKKDQWRTFKGEICVVVEVKGDMVDILLGSNQIQATVPIKELGKVVHPEKVAEMLREDRDVKKQSGEPHVGPEIHQQTKPKDN